jgi:hypothetical protein
VLEEGLVQLGGLGGAVADLGRDAGVSKRLGAAAVGALVGVRSSGSSSAMTTRETPAATRASQQGTRGWPVLEDTRCAQGSSVT